MIQSLQASMAKSNQQAVHRLTFAHPPAPAPDTPSACNHPNGNANPLDPP